MSNVKKSCPLYKERFFFVSENFQIHVGKFLFSRRSPLNSSIFLLAALSGPAPDPITHPHRGAPSHVGFLHSVLGIYVMCGPRRSQALSLSLFPRSLKEQEAPKSTSTVFKNSPQSEICQNETNYFTL